MSSITLFRRESAEFFKTFVVGPYNVLVLVAREDMEIQFVTSEDGREMISMSEKFDDEQMMEHVFRRMTKLSAKEFVKKINEYKKADRDDE